MLKFFDDTQVGVIGLDGIMAELYAEGRKATDETVQEIIKRLEAKKNYIPSSESARKEYAYALLKEYRTYVKERPDNGRLSLSATICFASLLPFPMIRSL
jgi:predicted transcriptional regulator